MDFQFMKMRILLILPFIAAGCTPMRQADFSPPQPHLKVVTYNVNWGFVRPTMVIDFLNGTDADIICLQETHSRWEMALKSRFSLKYPYCVFKDSPVQVVSR